MIVCLILEQQQGGTTPSLVCTSTLTEQQALISSETSSLSSLPSFSAALAARVAISIKQNRFMGGKQPMKSKKRRQTPRESRGP
jgi:hypothetical protein